MTRPKRLSIPGPNSGPVQLRRRATSSHSGGRTSPAAPARGASAWTETSAAAKTLTHGDYRLDNILFGEGDGSTPICIVDWQTVGVGQGAGKDFLSRVAQQGRGRFYFSQDGTDVPRIFSRETVEVTRNAVIGKVHRLGDVPLIVTYHPAYLLRSPTQKRKSWDDLCLAMAAFAGEAQ